MHTLKHSSSISRAGDQPEATLRLEDYGLAEGPTSKLFEYASAIIRGWRIVLLFGLMLLVLALLARVSVPLRYSARVVLDVRSPNERFMNREAFDSRSVNSAIGAESYLQTQLQLLDGDQLYRNVLQRIAKSPGGAVAVSANLGIDEAELLSWQGRAPERMRAAVRARVLPQTRLIELVVNTASPPFSAELANVMAAQFIEEEGAAQRGAMAETRQMLAHEIDDLKARLLRSQDELERFLRRAGLLMSAKNENIQEGQLVQAQGELSRAEAERIRAQSQYEQIAQSDTDSLTDVLSDTTLKDYRTNLATLRRELADLSTTLTPKHYRIQKVRAQIDLAEKDRAAYQRRIVNKIRNEYESAARRERLLTGSYKQLAARLTDQTTKGFRYSQLKGEMDTNRQIYESMLARLKETEVISAIGTSNIRVVDPAWPAPRPNAPNLWQSGLLGLGGGLLLGALAAIGRQSTSRALGGAGDVAAMLHLPGVLVNPTGPAPLSRQGTVDLNGWGLADLESYATIIGSIENGERQPPGPGRTGLEWAEPASQCLVVSSPGRGDGKSITTAGLGLAMARGGRQVLLINGDLRRPRLHELFDVDNSEGLADLLVEGDLTHLMKMVRSTPVRGLSILPGGPAVGETMQLFDSALLSPLLNNLRGQFDLVLIDTPSLLEAADARLVARHADGVILVVRSGHTDRGDLAAAQQRLASFGLPLSGVVLSGGVSSGRRGAAA